MLSVAKMKSTSDVEDDGFSDGGDSVQGAAHVNARVGGADVGDDQQSPAVILRSTGRQSTFLFAPSDQHLIKKK